MTRASSHASLALLLIAAPLATLASGCTVGRSVLGGPTDAGRDITTPDVPVTDGRSDGGGGDADAGGCTSDSQCPADQYCDTTSRRCVPGCHRDEGCPMGTDTPHCNVATHTCVRCVMDEHCPAGMLCRGNQCVMGCNAMRACPMGQTCCSDACVDTQSNTANCGGCGMMCNVPNAEAACAMGRCAVGRCTGTFGNCDRDAANGCETNTQTDPAHCGACDMACPMRANATSTCAMGMCGYTCNAGFADCNMDPADGCEVNLNTDMANCGMCGTRCTAANGAAACGMGTCRIAMCDPGYADCDMMYPNGCEVDTRTSTAHCGACGMMCPMPPNATAGCAMGACGVGMCNPGFADCNMMAADGCEVDTRTTAAHCGGCGMVCSPANATGVCAAGACSIGMCNPGFADCNMMAADGCEISTATDTDNCGACGNRCPTPPTGSAVCRAGVCGVGMCPAPLADCDGLPGNGCEVNTNTNVAHCGACGVMCPARANATSTCSSGTCGFTCNAGFADCDGSALNGCEVNLNTDVNNCRACGTRCPAPVGGAAVCTAGVCSQTCPAGQSNCGGTCRPTGAACTSAGTGGCQNTGTVVCSGTGTACSATPRTSGACTTPTGGQCDAAGNCVCPVGQTACSGVCRTLATDLANCGACGRVCSAGQACVAGACVGSGTLRFTLTWSTPGDMDLHVLPPAPCAEIYYGARMSCGGNLDRDDTTGTGPENVNWVGTYPPGTYYVCPEAYSSTVAGATWTLVVVRGGVEILRRTGVRGRTDGNTPCNAAFPGVITVTP